MNARAVAALGMLAFVLFSLGCMSFTFGGRHEIAGSGDGEFSQKGNAFVRVGDEVCVYYPTPYQSPPNLELGDAGKHNLRITDQAADHFRVQNLNSMGVNVAWEARGVKTAGAPANPQPTPVTDKPNASARNQ
jgi:hypothetical protein